MWGNPRAPVDQSVDRYSYEVKVASSSLAWSKIQFENSIKPYAGHNITGPATPKNFDNLAIVKNLCNSPPFCAIRSSYDQGANFGRLRRDAPRPPMFPHLADLLELCARHLYLPKRSLSALSKHSRPLFIGRLGFWDICVGARVPAVVYVGHPRHSNTVQGFPADDAGHRTAREAILPNPLDNQRAKLSIGPVNKTGGPDPLSFCLLLQTRQNYAFGATLKTVLSRPIRDTGGAEHPRGRQYT